MQSIKYSALSAAVKCMWGEGWATSQLRPAPFQALYFGQKLFFSTSLVSASFMGSVKKQLYMDKKNKDVMGHG